MKLSVIDNKVCWQRGDTPVCAEVLSICHAIYAPESEVIATLSSPESSPQIISIFDLNGHLKVSILEPKGMTFNYLDGNRGSDLAVMVKVYKSGWCDWWYSINPSSGELSSLGEGR